MTMQAPNPSRAELSINNSTGRIRVIALELDKYELGRANSNALCFPEAQGISRKHLVFKRNGSKWLVRDLGSTNGTFVNGVRLSEPRVLSSRDRVTAGELSIVFSEATPSARAPASQTVLFVEGPVTEEIPTIEATLDGVLSADREFQGSAHMRALIQAGRELCGHTSLEELFEVIMKLSMEAVGAVRGVLMTIEELPRLRYCLETAALPDNTRCAYG
jgi:adenylate cyclase